MIAIVIIATGGDDYTRYVEPLVASLRQYFPPCHVVLFTDSKDKFSVDFTIPYPNLGWPGASLLRYHAILSQEPLLSGYEHVFFMDTDMIVVDKIVEDELLADGIIATLHPGCVTDFERRPESAACVHGNHPYYQACLIGGKTEAFFAMCRELVTGIDTDVAAGISARNYDESHLNRYLSDHPPARVLPGAFAYPAMHCIQTPWAWPIMQHQKPRIRHIEKTHIKRVW